MSVREDRAAAEAILRHPVIYDAVTDDGSVAARDFRLPDGWLAPVAFLDGTPIAAAPMHALNSVTLQAHVAVLPEYRGRWADKCGRAFIEWAFKRAAKVTAQIPTLYPKTILFAQRIGMELEGVNRASFLKNGELHDQVHMGITYE